MNMWSKFDQFNVSVSFSAFRWVFSVFLLRDVLPLTRKLIRNPASESNDSLQFTMDFRDIDDLNLSADEGLVA